MEPYDAESLGRRLRPTDSEEACQTTGCEFPWDALHELYMTSAAALVWGTPALAAGGVIRTSTEGVGSVWLLFDQKALDPRKVLHRATVAVLEGLEEHFHTLVCISRSDLSRNHKWLNMLGFKSTGEIT